MNFQNLTIGFGMTASHCTHDEVLPQMKRLVELGKRDSGDFPYGGDGGQPVRHRGRLEEKN